MGESTTRPPTLDDLKKLMQSLNEADAPYLLVGGYAMFVQPTLALDRQRKASVKKKRDFDRGT